MKKIALSLSSVFLLTGCTHLQATAEAQNFKSAECKGGQLCTAEGRFEMSSDGHGYIGILDLQDGRCINVSLPEAESRRLLGQPPVQKTFTGKYLPFIREANTEVLVNGRRVGIGVCGQYYIFVK